MIIRSPYTPHSIYLSGITSRGIKGRGQSPRIGVKPKKGQLLGKNLYILMDYKCMVFGEDCPHFWYLYLSVLGCCVFWELGILRTLCLPKQPWKLTWPRCKG